MSGGFIPFWEFVAQARADLYHACLPKGVTPTEAQRADAARVVDGTIGDVAWLAGQREMWRRAMAEIEPMMEVTA